jgi:ABC-type uncharacterized transport system auxiliary subunit
MDSNFRTNFQTTQPGDALFRYSITSHRGDWREGRSRDFGWEFGTPFASAVLKGPQRGRLQPSEGLCRVVGDGVLLTTVKQAEDGQGIILRLVETNGEAGVVRVALPHYDIAYATVTNLVEEDQGMCRADRHSVEVKLRPYGIATIRCLPAGPVQGPLAVHEFRCPEYLCEGRIVYRPSPEEVGFYEYQRWAMSPGQAITQYVADTVRAQSVFKSVTIDGRDIKAGYILSGSIDHFEEVDQGHDVRALCTISAQLVDAATGSVVWTQTASEAVPVEKRDVPGVVVSLSAAARATVDRLVKSMTSQLASRAR